MPKKQGQKKEGSREGRGQEEQGPSLTTPPPDRPPPVENININQGRDVCLFRFLARSLKSSKDDQPAMSVALSPSSFFASQRVAVMYVCFGFSLARSHQARMIDLQCQSISLRRVCVASRRVSVMYVCVGCLLTSNEDDRSAMSVAISPSSFFASQCVPVTAPDRQEFCRSLADSLDPRRHLGTLETK